MYITNGNSIICVRSPLCAADMGIGAVGGTEILTVLVYDDFKSYVRPCNLRHWEGSHFGRALDRQWHNGISMACYRFYQLAGKHRIAKIGTLLSSSSQNIGRMSSVALQLFNENRPLEILFEGSAPGNLR